ncbi:MAG TPA: YciI family protein [Chloroflexota bacterium]|jgi:hypothetical protein
MKQYILTIYQPDGPPPSREQLEPVMRTIGALNEEIQAAGAWVFTAGLHPPHTATVMQLRDGDVLMTDGPYAEGKEYIGGFTIVSAPDLDAALGWARKLAQALTFDQRSGLAVEVRPLQGEIANPET